MHKRASIATGHIERARHYVASAASKLQILRMVGEPNHNLTEDIFAIDAVIITLQRARGNLVSQRLFQTVSITTKGGNHASIT